MFDHNLADARVYTCEADGSNFTEHLLNHYRDNEITLCHKTYETAAPAFSKKQLERFKSLSAISIEELKKEKNWFYEHDRDDVEMCISCYTKLDALEA